MKDKELLMKAIDSYDAYTPKQREILKTLVGFLLVQQPCWLEQLYGP